MRWLLIVLLLLAVSPVSPRRLPVLRCTDGASCDADHTRNGSCTLNICGKERPCACAPLGCCFVPQFCPSDQSAPVHVVLALSGKRKAEQEVRYGVARFLVRCRRAVA